MKEIYCDKCGKQLKPGSQAIAITAGSISKYDEGFSPDEDPYIKTLCGDCCDVSKAIEDAPRSDLESCPKCKDQSGFNRLGRTCKKCKGLGVIRKAGK